MVNREAEIVISPIERARAAGRKAGLKEAAALCDTVAEGTDDIEATYAAELCARQIRELAE